MVQGTDTEKLSRIVSPEGVKSRMATSFSSVGVPCYSAHSSMSERAYKVFGLLRALTSGNQLPSDSSDLLLARLRRNVLIFDAVGALSSCLFYVVEFLYEPECDLAVEYACFASHGPFPCPKNSQSEVLVAVHLDCMIL